MDTCIYKDVCGGCDYQGISYNKQIELKNKEIDKLLSSFCKVNPILKMKDPTHYRNKIQVTFGKDDRNRIIYGNYVLNSHILVPIDDCLICDRNAIDIIKTIKNLLIKYKISVFDENRFKGCLRHVLIRTNHNNEQMVILVTGNVRIPKVNLFIKELILKHPNIISIVQNINDKRTSMILDKKSFILYGDGYLYDKLCGNEFKIGFDSFYQVNKTMTQVLYNTAIDFAGLKGNETAFDAYCGIGTISLALARKVKQVEAVEINNNAIKDAIINKKINNINNVHFVCADASEYMSEYVKRNKELDVLFVDPPRSGCDSKFLKSVLKIKPKKIIYISCNPYTLKDNLLTLCKNGLYSVKKIQPVDMFPCTKHVECVVSMQINNNL